MDPYRKLPVALRAGTSQGVVTNVNDKKETLKKVKQFLAEHLPDPSALNKYHDFEILLSKVRKDKKIPTEEGKKKMLTSKRKRDMGIHKLPKKGGITYSQAMDMNHIWCGYMKDLLDLKADVTVLDSRLTEVIYSCLPKADFHGCEIAVSASRNPSHVGIKGIVVMETRNTLQIVGEDNKLRILPKLYTNFTFRFLGLEFTLFGRNMATRPAERSVKKIKQAKTISIH